MAFRATTTAAGTPAAPAAVAPVVPAAKPRASDSGQVRLLLRVLLLLRMRMRESYLF